MKQFHRLTHLAVFGLACALFAGSLCAQDPQESKRRDRTKSETTMTGCLTKDTSGNYTLTDEKTGTKTTVTGGSDLEKHASNHKVTLVGMTKNDASGNPVFEVSKIQHVSTSCTAPSR
jgi:hypothetical protein